jgi:chromosome segregation ATPase
MEAILESQRQAPREEILAIGNFSNKCQNEDAFIETVHEYVRALQKSFPNIRILNYSIHRDEEVKSKGEASNIHAHLRTCYVYTNEAGDFEPNQSKALAEMGITAPKPDEKIDRWNNPMMTLTEQCRELYIEIAMRHGFAIETVPASPGKRTLNKQEYVAQQLREENEKLTAEQVTLQTERDNLEHEIQDTTRKNLSLRRKQEKLEKKVEKLKREEGRLRSILWRLKELLSPLENLLLKLQNFRLSPTRSLLDDVLLDAKTAGCAEILREIEDYK